MYLKEIVASGFKSFADKISIKLDGKTTCIVGPNGSGKSNVVDAVRWVLGEQSVKSLRGDGSMSDVIFSGSKTRNPLNVASVELIFDNTDHFLNVSYTDISIKRRVYRSGENEYFLNNEKCRLKDITNLLMDSGMAKESFNIISQGEVDKILSNSSLDRRVIFEEASGIIKYKKRKEEALRKLDKTHNNLDRVNDIISELERQVGPLKEQSEKALEYLENKKGLDKYEVALLAYDIENLNSSLEQAHLKKESLDKEILDLTTDTTKNDALCLDISNKLAKLEDEKNTLNKKLLEVVEEVEKINGEKRLLKEKSKTEKEDNTIKEEIRTLLEEKSKLEKEITILKEEVLSINKEVDINKEKEEDINKLINSLQDKKNMYNMEFTSLEREIISLEEKISSLHNKLEEGGDMPLSVRKVLSSTTLEGIHNTIGNVLNIEEKFTKALDIAITSNRHFIITSNEENAKEAINYLKDNHLGRATFFPLSIIKPRYIDTNSLDILRNNPTFLGVMSDLVTYNKKYEAIIKNQLGCVIVTDTLDSATRLSHLISAKYKIVTLDGDVVNVGGSLVGGSLYKSKSLISLRQEISEESKKVSLQKENKEKIREKLDSISKEIEDKEEELFALEKEGVTLISQLMSKKKVLCEAEEKLVDADKEWETLQSISNNSLDKREEELIKLFHEKSTEKEQITLNINSLSKEIDSLKEEQEEMLAKEKLASAKLKSLEKESKDIEIEINRFDVKLDNMLNLLETTYEITFDKAKSDYKLDVEVDLARKKVTTYKNNIKRIGMVNLDAIEEYKVVNTRYVFLTNQKEDLLKAEDTLLEIMNEMDEVMKEEFYNTFISIKEEFRKVFKELFGGGNADLKLTNEEDLLSTGVDIVASPPGKKLTTISLLSGGEKTLTAISLLFAILNVRTVPFCLFDEVEAALDEANVSRFGEYLEHYRDKTQFLIITHKKKTMEYANTLYGITMQESGVSKLVSVKLEDHKEVI